MKKQIEETTTTRNFKALEYVTWLKADSDNVQNYARTLFNGGFDSEDIQVQSLKQALEKSIKEVEDDILNIKNFLS